MIQRINSFIRNNIIKLIITSLILNNSISNSFAHDENPIDLNICIDQAILAINEISDTGKLIRFEEEYKFLNWHEVKQDLRVRARSPEWKQLSTGCTEILKQLYEEN